MSGRFINIILPFRGLPGPVYVLFISRVINRMGDFVRFFLALYLTRILGFTPGRASLVVTAASVAGMVGVLSVGWVSDLIGHKKAFLTFQIINSIVFFICGFSPDASWLPVALIISQFFFGAIRPAGQALLTDITPVKDRKKAFGMLYFGINIGTALGPLIAGFLFESHRQWIFWGDACTTLIGVVLVAWKVPEPSTVHRGDAREDHDDSGALKAFFHRPILVGFTATMFIAAFIYAQTHFAIPLMMDTLFDASGARYFGILMSVNAVTVLVLTPITLHFFGHRRTSMAMMIGGVCYLVGFGCLAFIPGVLRWILISTVVWTWGEVLFATNARAFSVAHTPVNHRSRFASIEQLTWGLGSVLAPLAAGVFTHWFGARGLWYPISAFAVLVIIGMAMLSKWEKP